MWLEREKWGMGFLTTGGEQNIERGKRGQYYLEYLKTLIQHAVLGIFSYVGEKCHQRSFGNYRHIKFKSR